MKKSLITAALVMTMAAGLGAVAGCSSEPAATHDGRFDSLGANGCYGCHGANDQANPMLNGSVALPEDHYADGGSNSKELEPTRTQCITCHVQG